MTEDISYWRIITSLDEEILSPKRGEIHQIVIQMHKSKIN